MNGNSARTFVFAPTLLRSLGSSRPQTRRSHIRRASFRSSTVAAARVLPECGGPSMKSNLGAIDSCASAMTRFAATIGASRRIVFSAEPAPARARAGEVRVVERLRGGGVRRRRRQRGRRRLRKRLRRRREAFERFAVRLSSRRVGVLFVVVVSLVVLREPRAGPSSNLNLFVALSRGVLLERPRGNQDAIAGREAVPELAPALAQLHLSEHGAHPRHLRHPVRAPRGIPEALPHRDCENAVERAFR